MDRGWSVGSRGQGFQLQPLSRRVINIFSVRGYGFALNFHNFGRGSPLNFEIFDFCRRCKAPPGCFSAKRKKGPKPREAAAAKPQKFQNSGGNPEQNCENLGQTPNLELKKCGFLVVKVAKVENSNSQPPPLPAPPSPIHEILLHEGKTQKTSFIEA